MSRHHHISGYHPERSVEQYVVEFIRDIFDECIFYKSYDIEHVTDTVLKIIPRLPKRTSISNRIIAGAAIWRVFHFFIPYPEENIPYLTQIQICKVCNISDVSLRKASHYIEDSYINND